MLSAEGVASYRLDLVDGLGGCSREVELATEGTKNEVPSWPGVEEGIDWNRNIGSSKHYNSGEWLHIYN